MGKTYVIYDERAITMGTDEASVCCCADTLAEARRDVRMMFPGCPIYSYDVRKGRGADELINEQLVEYKPKSDLPEDGR